MAFSNLTSDSASKPSLVMSRRRFSLSSSRSTIFSPQSVGRVEARSDRVLQFQWRIHDQLKDSVNAEADPEFFFVRLHVNVAGPALHGIGEHQVHELDDGSFVGSFLQFLELEFLLFAL